MGETYLLKTGKALRFNKENQEYVSKKKDELNKKNIELKRNLKKLLKKLIISHFLNSIKRAKKMVSFMDL